MAETVFSVLRKKLKDDINMVTDSVANGGAADHAAYKEMCGVIRGLSIALNMVTDLEDRIHRGDEDD